MPKEQMLASNRTKNDLIQFFKYQVMRKPDLSEIQVTLLELTTHIPELIMNSDYRAIIASCFMLSGPLTFTELSDLVYEYEKRVNLPNCFGRLLDHLEQEY